MWGSHKGNTSLFYQFSREARAGKGGWSHHLTTIEDAVEQGLVEKINETRGTKFTREGFLDDCRKRAKLPGVYEEAYMCNPQGSIDSIAPWAVLQRCVQAYTICRAHSPHAMVVERFGEYVREQDQAREMMIHGWMDEMFGEVRQSPAHYRLGFDIAASGQGDLGAFYVDSKEGDVLRLRSLLTTQTEDWHFLGCAARWFMRHLTGIVARGDETGLGRNICWLLAKEFPGAFQGVNFRTSKVDMGTRLMTQINAQLKVIPEGHPDIAADYFALQKTHEGGKFHFYESRNEYLDASHCDIAWAGALASEADHGGGGPFHYQSIHKSPRSMDGWGNRRVGRSLGM